MSCLCFFTLCLFIVILDNDTKIFVLGAIVIIYCLSLLFWLQHLRKCARIIGTRPSRYYLLIFFPVLGQTIAYLMLKRVLQSIYFVY